MSVTTDERPARHVPILMYHHVSPRPIESFRRFTVSPPALAAQMRWLAMAGYEAVSLGALVRHRTSGAPLPRRAVVITFDDGYQEAIEHAMPILGGRGFTATFFLVAGLVGGSSRWLRDTRGFELPLVDWSTARELQAAGFTCGAHTVSHPRLAQLSDTACRDELRRSRQLLEDGLGVPVVHLAYPYGSYDERVRQIVQEVGYESACSTRVGLSGAGDDLLALRRVEISGLDSLADFICRVETARTPREALRSAARAVRRQVSRVTGRRVA